MGHSIGELVPIRVEDSICKEKAIGMEAVDNSVEAGGVLDESD